MATSVCVLVLTLTSVTLTVGWPCDCDDYLIRCNVYHLGGRVYRSLERSTPKGNVLVSPAGLWWVLYQALAAANGPTQTDLKHAVYPKSPASCDEAAAMDKTRTRNASYLIFVAKWAPYWIHQHSMASGKILETFKAKRRYHTAYTREDVEFGTILDGVQYVRDIWTKTYKHRGNFLQAGDITKNTVYVMQSMVKLNGKWRIPSSKTENSTHRGRAFTMIEFTGVFRRAYDKSRRTEFIFMDFTYAQLQLVIAVPGPELETVETSWDMFDPEDKEPKQLKFTIPKFKFEVEYSLKQVMEDIDCRILFNKECDLSGINGVKVPTSQVIQKTIFRIEEEGVMMEAHTALVGDPSGSPRDQRHDGSEFFKPFLFFLFGEGGMLVAQGRIMDPTE